MALQLESAMEGEGGARGNGARAARHDEDEERDHADGEDEGEGERERERVREGGQQAWGMSREAPGADSLMEEASDPPLDSAAHPRDAAEAPATPLLAPVPAEAQAQAPAGEGLRDLSDSQDRLDGPLESRKGGTPEVSPRPSASPIPAVGEGGAASPLGGGGVSTPNAAPPAGAGMPPCAQAQTLGRQGGQAARGRQRGRGKVLEAGGRGRSRA